MKKEYNTIIRNRCYQLYKSVFKICCNHDRYQLYKSVFKICCDHDRYQLYKSVFKICCDHDRYQLYKSIFKICWDSDRIVFGFISAHSISATKGMISILSRGDVYRLMW